MNSPLDPDMQKKYAQLQTLVKDMGRVVVAYSGGVDSSLVAHVAAECLGDAALAVTSGSASLKRSDLALAKTLADRWGMRHEIIVTDELEKADYRANPVNRCFHCKTSLYTALADIAEREEGAIMINGTNTDDLGDHRPGLVAAADHAVRSPLVEAGFNKADVRTLAAWLGLENAQKPQSACLSSRFPYGAPITKARLAQVEQAETVLADMGFRDFRVRHHETVARLEISVDELALALQQREAINDQILACGYRYVALDLGGFRSGSLNEGLDASQLIKAVEVHS